MKVYGEKKRCGNIEEKKNHFQVKRRNAKRMNVKWSKSICSVSIYLSPFLFVLFLLSLFVLIFFLFISEKKLTFIQRFFHNIVYLFKSSMQKHAHKIRSWFVRALCARTHACNRSRNVYISCIWISLLFGSSFIGVCVCVLVFVHIFVSFCTHSFLI